MCSVTVGGPSAGGSQVWNPHPTLSHAPSATSRRSPRRVVAATGRLANGAAGHAVPVAHWATSRRLGVFTVDPCGTDKGTVTEVRLICAVLGGVGA